MTNTAGLKTVNVSEDLRTAEMRHPRAGDTTAVGLESAPALTGEPQAWWIIRHPLGRLLLLCLAFLVMAAHFHTRLYMAELEGRDYRHYWAMESSRELVPVPAPFAYRWVPHKVVPYLPLEPKRAHEIINAVALCATSWIVAEWLIRMGCSAGLAIPVVVLGFTWSLYGGAYFLWGRFATEPVAYLLIAMGIYLAHFGALWQLVPVLVLATLSREQSLLLVPYYFLVRRGSVSLQRCTLETILLGVVAMTCFIVVRAVTPTVGDYTWMREIARNLALKFGSLEGFVILMVGLLLHSGLISIILLLFPAMSWSALRSHPALALWLAGSALLAVIGGAETDRLLYSAFPAELLAFCVILQRVGFAWTQAWMPTVIVFVMGQTVLAGTFADGQFHLPNYTPLWCGISAAIWTAALWFCWYHRRRSTIGPRTGSKT